MAAPRAGRSGTHSAGEGSGPGRARPCYTGGTPVGERRAPARGGTGRAPAAGSGAALALRGTHGHRAQGGVATRLSRSTPSPAERDRSNAAQPARRPPHCSSPGRDGGDSWDSTLSHIFLLSTVPKTSSTQVTHFPT